MEFLIDPRKPSKAAHIWTGTDTACRMCSTGGLNRKKYTIASDRGERRICTMCEAKSGGSSSPSRKSHTGRLEQCSRGIPASNAKQSSGHPDWWPDRPAPQAAHDQFKLGEITEADYCWLIGKDDDEHEQNEWRHRRNKRERGGWVR